MIQLLRPPKPQKLADNEAELTERFKKNNKDAVWNRSYIRSALLEIYAFLDEKVIEPIAKLVYIQGR